MIHNYTYLIIKLQYVFENFLFFLPGEISGPERRFLRFAPLAKAAVLIYTNFISEREVFGMKMKVDIKGMHCAHCKSSVERALGGVPGVSAVKVNLKKGQAVIKGAPDEAAVRAAVEAAGFEYAGAES